MPSISDILFNATASFYRLNEGADLSLDLIESILRSASCDKVGDSYYAFSMNVSVPGLDGVTYSYVAFKVKNRPYAIKIGVELDGKWLEIKFAYFLLVQCKQYVAVSRKYVSIPSELSKIIQTIDYKTFANFLVTEDTSFQKFGMFNLDISPSAMRYKQLEAVDLKDSFSSTGAGNYELSSCMLSNANETVSLSMNLSRLHQSGKRVGIDSFCSWVSRVVDKISSYDDRDTYISRFARPIPYPENKEDLIPINVLFLAHRIEEYYHDYANEIVLIYTFDGGQIEKTVDLRDLIRYLSSSFWIETKEKKYVIKRNAESVKNEVGGLELSEKSIRLIWTRKSKLYFKLNEGGKVLFSTVLNEIQAFVVYFQNSSFRYADRKLFANSLLVKSVPSFLNVFQKEPGLNNTTSEKGEPTESSTEFDENTIFRFIMDNKEDKYLVLDDMGTEWGDFIGITDNTVTIYVAKSKHKCVFSASAFQESIAQGLKNIGSFYPPERLLDSKINKWKEKYNKNTQISRIQGDATSEMIVEAWRKAIMSPFYKKRLVIVTDCISYDVLEKKMEMLQKGKDFPEIKEAIPMLWLISSFISSCLENGIEPKIYCKEKSVPSSPVQPALVVPKLAMNEVSKPMGGGVTKIE